MKRFALFLLASAALWAQSPAEIRGFAWDAEGHPIPEAKVTFHGAGSEKDRTVTAAADGSFDVKDLPPGRYDITAAASKQQLATEAATTVELKAGETSHADLTLGLSTVHYGFWKRLARRFDGLH
jgi:hypothetical protein